MPLWTTHDSYPHDYADLPNQLDYIDQRNWDCLLVFDACRWDALSSIMHHDDVEAVATPGSNSTPHWVTSVWYRHEWENLTYIAGNPMVTGLTKFDSYPDETLDEYVDEYIEADGELWDDTVRTCLPGPLTDLAMDYDPPLVVHYLQPHTPFVGNVGFRVNGGRDSMWGELGDGDKKNTSTEYSLVMDGAVSPEYARSAYMANLKLVWDKSQPLRQKYKGDCVITADHGERLGGENDRRWDHGRKDQNQSRVVPWLER